MNKKHNSNLVPYAQKLRRTMTKEERKALKQIALDNETTVSALLRLWLKEYQKKKEGEK